AALRTDRATTVPIRVDTGALRARGADVPALLRGLAPHTRRAAVSSSADAGLLRRLSGLGDSERAEALLELVRGRVAAILGHAGSARIDPGRPFQELGFDSLT